MDITDLACVNRWGLTVEEVTHDHGVCTVSGEALPIVDSVVMHLMVHQVPCKVVALVTSASPSTT